MIQRQKSLLEERQQEKNRSFGELGGFTKKSDTVYQYQYGNSKKMNEEQKLSFDNNSRNNINRHLFD